MIVMSPLTNYSEFSFQKRTGGGARGEITMATLISPNSMLIFDIHGEAQGRRADITLHLRWETPAWAGSSRPLLT